MLFLPKIYQKFLFFTSSYVPTIFREMMNKDGGQIEARYAAFLLALIVFTGIGGLFVSKASIGISLLAIASFVIGVASFLSTETALYLLITSMLLSPELVVGSAQDASLGRGITLRVDDILLIVIGFSWFLRTAIRKELGLFLRTPLNKPIAYYFVVCLVATLIGSMMGRVKGSTGFLFVLKYFEYFIVYFMAVNHLREKKQVERFVAAMLVVCLVISIIAILQIPSGARVTAPFEGGGEGEPNTLGGYLVLMLSITLGLLLTPGSTKKIFFLGLLVILIVIPLLATLSRSSWLAAVPMLIVLIYYTKKKMAIILPLVIIAIISPFFMPKTVKERASYTFNQPKEEQQVEIGDFKLDTSTSARIYSWENTLKDFSKHPVFGYGITGYGFMDGQYPRVLIETGILGLVAFLLLLFSIYKNALNTYRSVSDPFFRGISLGYLAGFMAMLIHAIGTNIFIIVRIMEPFWFLTAIVIMLPKLEAGELKVDASGSA